MKRSWLEVHSWNQQPNWRIARGWQLVQALCERQGIGLDEVAFMGDDLPDLAPLCAAGLAVAPGNAHRWIAERVHWVTTAHGGQGAARELCDLLLDAQDRTEALLAEWTR